MGRIRPHEPAISALAVAAMVVALLALPGPLDGTAHGLDGAEGSQYTFIFADGTVITGSNQEGGDGYTGNRNDADIGLSTVVHVSCSDSFGFDNSDPADDGWGEKGAPVEGVDPFPLTYYEITKFKADGSIEKTCSDGTPPPPPAPAIDVEKLVSVDGGASYHDADDPTGPVATVGADVWFRFEVTNTGETTLTNLTLTDSDFDTSSCAVPEALDPAEGFDCVIGPFAATEGQHADTATATGESDGGVLTEHPYPGVKHAFTFILADGTVIEGSSESNEAEVGLSDVIHVSCSDHFGFDNSDPADDGWGEKNAPVEGVDPAPIVAYLITKWKSPTEIDKTCGFGEVALPPVEVSDSDDAHYLGAPPPPTSAIGDRVWLDSNADGVQDPDEVGVEGVCVSLVQDGTVVATTTTDANGNYLFEGLEAGSYQVEFCLPEGAMRSPIDVGGDDTDSDADPETGLTETIELGEDVTDLSWDSGIFYKAKVGDFVWWDLDVDGIQDPDEPGYGGVTVNLLQDGAVVASTTTDADGFYSFEELVPGDYQIQFVHVQGAWWSVPNQGDDDEADSDPDQRTGLTEVFTLRSGDCDFSRDAGLFLKGTVGDRVWWDADRDGMQDFGEPGLAGVVVNLLQDGQVVKTTTTNANGRYRFRHLIPGDYQVEFVAPDGWRFTRQNAGDDAFDSDADRITGLTDVFYVASGVVDMTVDAGLAKRY